MKIRILGIYREKCFSNHAIDADKRVLDELLSVFKRNSSFEIDSVDIDLDGIDAITGNYDIYLSMAQGHKALNMLDYIESTGRLVINNSTSIRNCYRVEMHNLFKKYNIKTPDEYIVDFTNEENPNINWEEGYWLKRGDYHSIEDEDVAFIDSLSSFKHFRNNFMNRDISSALLQKHIAGDIYKFYGVGNKFFTPRFMGSTTSDRYNLNKVATVNSVNFDNMKKYIFKTSNLFSLNFYGGDFVVTPDLKYYIIDLNDWPSFRTCYTQAVPFMAELINEKIELLKKVDIKCSDITSLSMNLITA